MSLPVTGSIRPQLSDTSVVESSDSSAGSAEFDELSNESSSVMESHGSSRTGPDLVLSIRSKHAEANAEVTQAVEAVSCTYSWPAMSAMRGLAEFAWHGTGRVINSGCFVLLSNVPASGLRIAASVMAGVAAGHCSYRMVVTRTGDSPCGKALAAVAGLVTGAAAGTATYIGSGYPGLMVAAAGVAAFGASHVQHVKRRTGQAPLASAVPGAVVVATCGASIAVAVCTPALRIMDTGKLGRRTLALLAEAVSIEFFKGTSERMFPGIDRCHLPFERRLKAGMIALLPYALASVVFSGIAGNLLRAQMQSERFEHHLVPLLVGSLASVVKGAVNTAVLRCGGEWTSRGSASADGLRAPEGLRLPAIGFTIEKAALRFAIASARDVIYLSLVDGGMEEIPAACLAYSLYACFAQHRDLVFDMMQGEGWTEPRITPRSAVASS